VGGHEGHSCRGSYVIVSRRGFGVILVGVTMSHVSVTVCFGVGCVLLMCILPSQISIYTSTRHAHNGLSETCDMVTPARAAIFLGILSALFV